MMQAKTKKFKLLIFDWDGTLIDSEARIIESMQIASTQAGLTPAGDNDIRNIIGLELNQAIKQLYSDITDESIEKIANDYREHYMYQSKVPTPRFNGVLETLDLLKNKGYQMAVATGKGRQGLDRAMEEANLQSYFTITRCANETRSKPHPLMLEEILDELKLKPADAVMIGDTSYDMSMAQTANMAAVAVSYGVQKKDKLMQHNPLACIDNITTLPTIV
ncbi:Similar to phosphoglycolate phosphatase, clustered with ribosomal large subunit pseudouridine synthase C [hydrothermal vent metagenome]|uniref:Similar to phosphoglycolate phosphatase, clustered with ribosomal large subunit pseudouridine synthase C n=1 Tax=hydrothermal vent metagenome TaxID=652676 RepID=A0A3B0ZM50_9ZZZZ